MSERFAKQELLVLRNNPDFISSYEVAVQEFRNSGLLNFLRSVARCYVYDGGKDLNRSAAEAHFNAGYHACLDDILYFKELHLTESAQSKKVPLDFGGRRLALSKGDLLEGDFK